jgi:hypothetical protein
MLHVLYSINLARDFTIIFIHHCTKQAQKTSRAFFISNILRNEHNYQRSES